MGYIILKFNSSEKPKDFPHPLTLRGWLEQKNLTLIKLSTFLGSIDIGDTISNNIKPIVNTTVTSIIHEFNTHYYLLENKSLTNENLHYKFNLDIKETEENHSKFNIK